MNLLKKQIAACLKVEELTNALGKLSRSKVKAAMQNQEGTIYIG